MKKYATPATLAVVLLLATGASFGQCTTVGFNSGSTTSQTILYSDKMLTKALTAGNLAATGDGAIIALGYYQNATTGNLFGNGVFISLSGPGSPDTYTNTSIGDLSQNGAGAGTFALGLTFSTAAGSKTGNSLPAAGTPLAIQFYNGTTLANSTAYNAVSDNLWTWVAPADTNSVVSLSFDDNAVGSPLTWLGGASSAFYTSQAVPEPAAPVSLTLAGCLLGLAIWRRKALRGAVPR